LIFYLTVDDDFSYVIFIYGLITQYHILIKTRILLHCCVTAISLLYVTEGPF